MTALLTDTQAVAAVRGDAPQVAPLLDQLDATIATLRTALRINCPAELHVDAVADSRISLLAMFANDLRGYWADGTAYTDHQDEPEVDQDAATDPAVYAVTAVDLAHMKRTEWLRGFDAGTASYDTTPLAIEETG